MFKCAATENNHAVVTLCRSNELTSSVKDCRYLLLLLWIETFEDGLCGESRGETCAAWVLVVRENFNIKCLKDGSNAVPGTYLLGIWDL